MRNTNHPLLAVRDLHIGFRQSGAETDVVRGIDFDIKQGETLGLVGESGSGKSVSALSVLKLLPYPSAFHKHGKIMFQGEDLMRADETRLRAIRGNEIAMIFQEPMTSLNPLHSIEKQIGEILTLHQGMRKTEARTRTLDLLARVGIPNPSARLSALPHELSGGQRQRVMIAMALANNPKLLIADEPTTALDVTVQKQILDLLKNLQADTNMALLLITHDLGVVRHMADHICVMRDGAIVEAAPCKQIFSKPKSSYTRTLIKAEPSGRVAPIPKKRDAIVTADNVKVWFPLRAGLLRRARAYVRAVDGVSFTLAQGETLGIVGESGSGKTTLGRAVLGLQAAQGRVKIKGDALDTLSQAELRARRKIMQMVFQDPFGALSPRLSVAEIIGEGLAIHHSNLDAGARRDAVIAAMRDVELDPVMADRYPHEFSGGQRQRISIARAMVLNPQFVVLDEPTSALDRSVQAQIITLLKHLQKARGLSYLFISHDLKTVRALAHRVLVMKDGRVIESGTTQDIFDAPKNDYTKTLIAAAFE